MTKVKKWQLCVLLVNALVILWGVCNYIHQASDLMRLEFSREQLQQYTENKSIGGAIDEKYEAGLYDIIPDMYLEKGYYSYTVEFEGNSNGSFCWPHTYEEFYDVIEQQTVSFEGGRTEGSRKFWLNANLNIALRLYYSGEGSVTFKSFVIEETNGLANVELFNTLVVLLGLDMLLMLLVKEKKQPFPNATKYAILAVAAVATIASLPALTGYIVDGHDLRFHLLRIEGIRDALLAGQFPVRISPNFYNGYGYANSIFYGELFLYFPALLRVIGFSMAESWCAFLVAMNIATAMICYYCGKKIFRDDLIAVVVSLLYTLCPYRLVDIYTRAAIGEATAITFLPLLVYGLYRILTQDTSEKSYKHAYLPMVVGLTGVIQSHTLTVEMAGGAILLACVLFCFKTLQKKRFLMLVQTVVITLLVNVWFIVPFIDFTLTQDVRVFATLSVKLIQHTGLYFPQLFAMFSDYAQLSFSASSGVASEMTYSMGPALGLGILLLVGMLWNNNHEHKDWKKRGFCFLVIAIILTAMTTIYFPWDRISTTVPMVAKLISSIQFVWRFVGLAACVAAFVAGFGLILLHKSEGKSAYYTVAAVLSVLALVSAMDITTDTLFHKAPMDISEYTFKESNNTGDASAGEYVLCDERYEIVTTIFEPRCYEGVECSYYEKDATNITITVTSGNSDGYVLLPLQNYKGYGVDSEDGVIKDENLVMGPEAVVRINIPANYSGTLHVKYKGFWYWRVAEVISFLTICWLIWENTKAKKLK